MSANLFSQNTATAKPLAEKLRPQQMEDFVGQTQLVSDTGSVSRLLQNDTLHSMIFWGPPGCGKTTLAQMVAHYTKSKFVTLSAVSSGVKDLRAVMDQAKTDLELHKRRTIVFVDEIHRWNKSQQDALLPFVEQGIIILIGATTENPSFELNGALLSRCQVYVFERLTTEQIEVILAKADSGFSNDILNRIAQFADGDARVALNTLERLLQFFTDPKAITLEEAIEQLKRVALHYDKAGEEHYNIISALHKTMRASDANAALYWCGRMLASGENPLYVMRRVVEFASEDIGNADPNALQVCNAAYQTVHNLGMPEGRYAVYQAVAYCANAPKSRAVYDAANAVEADIQNQPNDPVPMHLRNAPTSLMKELGYGKDKGQSNLPESLKGKTYIP